MDRATKQQWIDDANPLFGGAKIMLISHYQGLTVKEISALRGEVRKAGATFKVTKNLLAKRALKDTPYESLTGLFKGPTAVLLADDPVSAAKVLSAFSKDNEKLVLVGGAFGSHALDAAAIKQLATLPSLDELRAKIVGLLNAPATKIAGVLQAPAGQLARVFGAYAAKE